MAKVFPFRGIMFNESMKNQLGDFLCPPFDVVDEDSKNYLYSLSEYNVIRLENGKISDKDNGEEMILKFHGISQSLKIFWL